MFTGIINKIGKINNIDNSTKVGINILAGSNSIDQKMQENLDNF